MAITTEFSSAEEKLNTFVRYVIASSIYTSIPGIIQSFDPSDQTVSVTPAIRSATNDGGSITYNDMVTIPRVPIQQIYGKESGFSQTIPIRKGDECLLVFCQRPIENWQINGGIQDPTDFGMPRTHDISDAIAIVGLTSAPNVISSYQQDCIESRSGDRTRRVSVYDDKVEIESGSSFVRLAADGAVTVQNTSGAKVELAADGSATLSNSTASSSVKVDATGVAITGILTINGSPYAAHVHSGGTLAGGLTGPPSP